MDGENRESFWGLMAFSLFCFLRVAVAISIAVDLERQNGEPFELAEGISIWPTVLLRLLAIALGISFVYAAIAKVRTDEIRIRELVGLKPKKSERADASICCTWWKEFKSAWGRILNPAKFSIEPSIATNILDDYSDDIRLISISARVAPLVGMFLLAAYSIFGLNQLTTLPFRGDLAWFWETTTHFVSLAVVVILLFLVIDLSHVGRRLIEALVDAEPNSWTREMLGLSPKDTESQLHLARVRRLSDILATHSQVIGGLVLYPSIVIFLFAIARLNVFDNWNLPWTIIVVLVVGVAGALYANFSLRRTARNEQEELIRQTKQELYTVRQMKRADEIDLYEQTIHDLQQERRGALRPLAEDPLIQAITLPFGGVGGVVLFEQFFNYYS